MGLKNRRKLFVFITLIAVLMLLISCGTVGDEDSKGKGSSDTSKDHKVYYNGAYGLSIEVPADWLVTAIIETNLTASPEESSDADSLTITPYEDTGSVIQLIELWNRPDSADKEHASLMVYIEISGNEGEDAFLSAFEEAYSGEFNGYFTTLVEKEEVVLDGKEYTLLQFITELPEGEDEYFEEYYISQIEADKYLVLCTTYWADNEVSKDNANSALKFLVVQ